MKKLYKSVIYSFALASAAFFTGCHDNIFELINQEVKLEKNGLNGNVRITRYHEQLVGSNGRIYYKTNKSSNETGSYNKQWRKASSPDSKKIDYAPTSTYFVASSSDTLYGLAYSWEESDSGANENTKRTIWYTQSADLASVEWKKLELPDGIESSTDTIIFDNKAFDEANRKAYARLRSTSDKTYHTYELSTSGVTLVTENGASSDSSNAVYFPKDGKTYFSPYYAMAANNHYIYFSESRSSGDSIRSSSQILCADGWGTFYTYSEKRFGEDETDPSGLYEKSGDTYTLTSDTSIYTYTPQTLEEDEDIKGRGLYEQSEGTYTLTEDELAEKDKTYYKRETKKYYVQTERTGFCIADKQIAPIAVSCNAGGILDIAITKDYLLLGTTSGIARTKFETDEEENDTYIPSSKISKFGNNGNSVISEYVFKVFTLNPNDPEGQNDEYACSSIYGSVSGSSDSWEDAGLYAYYRGRGTWNRDGTNRTSQNGN